MAAVRRADVRWQGNLAEGKGELDASTSQAFSSLPITWGSRTEQSDGRTSPEELLASAHASCFAMALSGDLARAGNPPDSLEVRCEVSFDRVDGKWTVVSSHLAVKGCVPGIDQARFASIAEQTRDNCPISRALQGNVRLEVRATLESGVPA